MIGMGGWLRRRPSILLGFVYIIIKQQKTTFAEFIIPTIFNHSVVVFLSHTFPRIAYGAIHI